MIALPSVREIGLIVHDMSNDALKPGGKYPRAEDAARDPGVQAYVANNVRLLAVRYGALRDGTWGAEPIEELAPATNEWRIRKGGGYSAFTATPLDKWLRRLGITTLIIGGAGTHAGIEATVRDMREHDYLAVIASDACSGVGTPHHTASMLTLTFAQIGSTQEIVEALEQATD